MNITTVSISNFRSINELTISGFKQFNLILGENNCGKSSFIESIQFCLGLPNGMLLNQINTARRLFNNDIFTAFHNLKYDKPIIFSLTTDKKESRILSINAPKINAQQFISRETSQQQERTIGLYKINVERFDGQKYSVEYSPEQHTKNPLYLPLTDNNSLQSSDIVIPSFYWTPDWSGYNYSNALSRLIINKQKELVIKALRAVDKNIQDIQLGANGGIFVDIGLSSLLPIPLMGQGIEKILAIITTLTTLKDGIILIDEFENGLHHTSMAQLWAVLFEICSSQNIQVFATTHSYECIESFIEKAPDENELSITRLERDSSENHTAVIITPEAAKEAIKERWELR